MTPRVYGTEGRERDLLPLTPALSRKGRGSKGCRAASHAASSPNPAFLINLHQPDTWGIMRP